MALRDSVTDRSALDRITRCIDEAIEEIRLSTTALSAPSLAELGLGGRLLSHCPGGSAQRRAARAGTRAVLQRQLDLEVVGAAADGPQTLDAVARLRPQVLLLDLTMPSLGGPDLITRLRQEAPETRVLVLSMHAGTEYMRLAMRAGAQGYLVKGAGIDDLVGAIRSVAGGEQYLDAQAMQSLRADAVEFSPPDDDLDRLTLREREVLRLVAEGSTNREIGERLGVSPKTVDAHRTNAMRKLDLHSAQALTRFALRRGLIPSE